MVSTKFSTIQCRASELSGVPTNYSGLYVLRRFLISAHSPYAPHIGDRAEQSQEV